MMTDSMDPAYACDLCPRLHRYLVDQRRLHADWHNGPVKTFLPDGGTASVRLLIVGLAPGLRGANRTGRPFTGDFAGDLLYGTLRRFGLSEGQFDARPDDGVRLIGTAITNAVRCVPPENKPTAAEVNTCRRYLTTTIRHFNNLHAILTLGKIAHDSTVRALGGRVSAHPFQHNGRTDVSGLAVFSSYHCSRYNTNTGRLTEEMFVDVFRAVTGFLSDSEEPGASRT